VDVVFEDPGNNNDVNINIDSIEGGTPTRTVTTGAPYGPAFLGGSLYYTSEFIISQTTRDLAGGGAGLGAGPCVCGAAAERG